MSWAKRVSDVLRCPSGEHILSPQMPLCSLPPLLYQNLLSIKALLSVMDTAVRIKVMQGFSLNVPLMS